MTRLNSQAKRPAPVVAVTSGKGGVGKTSVVVNLALALIRLQHRVTILDADLGLGNIDVLCGIQAGRNIDEVLRGEASIRDVVLEGPEGLRILPASSGAQELTSLSNEQSLRLHEALDELATDTDLLLVDTAAGIAANVVSLLAAADEVVIVTSPEPTAVLDAYAVVKLLARLEPATSPLLLVNSAGAEEAERVHRHIDEAAWQFLERRVRLLGHVPRDPAMSEAVRRREPLMSFRPGSEAALSFGRLGQRLLGQLGSSDLARGIAGFVQKLAPSCAPV